MAVLQLDECDFYTTTTDNGKFVGRVREFPDLRSAPQKTPLDATDEIITLTRRKLAQIADVRMGHNAVRRHA